VRILLFGKNGQLGWELQRTLALLGQVVALDYPQVDLAKPESIVTVIREAQPDIIVNAAAYTAVDRAESEPQLAMAINSAAPGVIAETALAQGAALIHYSTDYVFDGAKGAPYTEDDLPNPLGVYGSSKLAGERAIEQVGGAYLILRTSWLYSLRGDSFVNKVLSWARQNPRVRVVSDQIGNPTWARMLAEITAQVLAIRYSQSAIGRSLFAAPNSRFIIRNLAHAEPLNLEPENPDFLAWLRERRGIYHLAGSGYTNRLEWARAIIRYDPHPEEQIVHEILPALTSDFPTPARRPLFSALDCKRFTNTFGLALSHWEAALQLAME
jgi:dTDP-4-dehydrorhamnose reductase